jgi:hypothetical protein
MRRPVIRTTPLCTGDRDRRLMTAPRTVLMGGVPLRKANGVAEPAGGFGVGVGGQLSQPCTVVAVVVAFDADDEPWCVILIEAKEVTLPAGRVRD